MVRIIDCLEVEKYSKCGDQFSSGAGQRRREGRDTNSSTGEKPTEMTQLGKVKDND